MGKADVFIDGNLDQKVDTYDADEIPNVAVYSRTFPSVGQHSVKILARGDHNWRSSDNWVLIDALQVRKSRCEVIEDTPGKGVAYGGAGWTHSQGWSRASGESVSRTDEAGDKRQEDRGTKGCAHGTSFLDVVWAEMGAPDRLPSAC